jgi:hypothetical protein
MEAHVNACGDPARAAGGLDAFGQELVLQGRLWSGRLRRGRQPWLEGKGMPSPYNGLGGKRPASLRRRFGR